MFDSLEHPSNQLKFVTSYMVRWHYMDSAWNNSGPFPKANEF